MSEKENKKYQDLLKTGRELFFKHGTRRVTVEEICEKSRVSKMTFYKFFKNKDELLLEVLRQWIDKGIREYNEIKESNTPFIEKMEAIIRSTLNNAQEYGDDFFEELLTANEELINFFNEKNFENRQRSLEFYQQGKKEGIIRESMKPEFYVYLMDHFIEMMNDEKLKAIIPEIHERFEELLNFYFYGMNETDKKLLSR